jgi:hypothetical protein
MQSRRSRTSFQTCLLPQGNDDGEFCWGNFYESGYLKKKRIWDSKGNGSQSCVKAYFSTGSVESAGSNTTVIVYNNNNNIERRG